MLFTHTILMDTSAYFALTDKRDIFHHDALNFIKENTLPTLTTDYIIAETLNLINQRLGHYYAIETGKKLFEPNRTNIIKIGNADIITAWRIFQRYDDKGFSFTDCTTFAIMERLKIPAVFTFDEHFKQYGRFKCLP